MDGRSKYRNPYYDTDEFKRRWFSTETVESIALDLDITIQGVRVAALRRGFPHKKIARSMDHDHT